MRFIPRTRKVPKGYRRIRLGEFIRAGEAKIEHTFYTIDYCFGTSEIRCGFGTMPIYIKKP